MTIRQIFLYNIWIRLSYFSQTPEEANAFKKRKKKVKRVRQKKGIELMDDTLERRDFETDVFAKGDHKMPPATSFQKTGSDTGFPA